jgi:hypothetical protein
MAKIKANRKTLIRWKIYIDRARMYIGYIQFLMIALVFLESYKESYFGELIFSHTLISVPVIFILFIALSLILGRIDTVLGLREEELRNSSSSNPVMRDILKNLEEMKTEIRELKTNGK